MDNVTVYMETAYNSSNSTNSTRNLNKNSIQSIEWKQIDSRLKALATPTLILVMAQIDLYLFNPLQASVSYPFSSINFNTDADAVTDACGGQGLTEVRCNFTELFPNYLFNFGERKYVHLLVSIT